MAQYKVDTIRLSQCADRIQGLQWEMERIAGRLGSVGLQSVLQARVSPRLVSTIVNCTAAVGNQSNNLRKLSANLEQVNEIYKSCESGLKDPKDAVAAKKEETRDFWDGFIDFAGELNAPFGIGAAVWNLVTGDAKDVVSGAKDLISNGADLFENIVKINEDADAVWWKEIFGLRLTEKKTFGELLKKSIDEFFPGENATVVDNVTAVSKWAGVALSFVGSGIDNYDEFEGDMTNGRYWAETVMEGALDVGKGLLIGAAVGAAIGGAPAIVVAGVGAGIGLLADWACEQVFGKDVTELFSDAILDTGERIVEGIGEGLREVGQSIQEGVSAAWRGICGVFA